MEILAKKVCGARQVLDMRERALGPEHPEVASALNNLAVLLRAVDKAARPAHPLNLLSLASAALAAATAQTVRHKVAKRTVRHEPAKRSRTSD
jgi:hypothetical protein